MIKSLFTLIAVGCLFGGFIIFLQSMNNAFKRNFFLGITFLLFPVGSFFYYKKFLNEEKSNAINLSLCLGIGLSFFGIAKLL